MHSCAQTLLGTCLGFEIVTDCCSALVQYVTVVNLPISTLLDFSDQAKTGIDQMGPVCLCTSYMRTQDTLSCLK